MKLLNGIIIDTDSIVMLKNTIGGIGAGIGIAWTGYQVQIHGSEPLYVSVSFSTDICHNKEKLAPILAPLIAEYKLLEGLFLGRNKEVKL